VRIAEGSRGFVVGATAAGNLYAEIAAHLRANEREDAGRAKDPAPGAPAEVPVLLTDLDVETTFRATWNDGSPLAFELVAPDGAVITPQTLPAGVTHAAGSNGAVYRIPAPAPGRWTARATTAEVVAGTDLDVLVTTEGRLGVDLALEGAWPAPVLVRARVRTPEPVIGASVRADVTRVDDGALVLSLPLRDDGAGGDAAGMDGVYTGVIGDELGDGRYVVTAVAAQTGSAAVLGGGTL